VDRTALAYEHIIERFVAWARIQPDIRAAIVVGSRARAEDHPADEWADLDIMVFTTAPRRYLQQTDWMASIGNVWVSTRNYTVGGDPEWLTTFEDGLDVDFVFSSYRNMSVRVNALLLRRRLPWLMRLLPKSVAGQMEHGASLAAQVLGRGVRVLLDKDNLGERTRRALGQPPSPRPPTETEFAQTVHRFWALAERKARKICRGKSINSLNRSTRRTSTKARALRTTCSISSSLLRVPGRLAVTICSSALGTRRACGRSRRTWENRSTRPALNTLRACPPMGNTCSTLATVIYIGSTVKCLTSSSEENS